MIYLAIYTLNISYPDFRLNEIMDPEQFDINNNEIVTKVNEIIAAVNAQTSDGGVKTANIADGAITSAKVDQTFYNTLAALSNGHAIYDKNNILLPQRTMLKFTNSTVTDDGTRTIVEGIKGDKGATGAQGIQGIQGIQGQIGYSIVPSIDANGVMSFSLQQTAIAPNPVSVRGPQGPQGIQGSQGVAGPKGDTGIQGIQGLHGVQGNSGIVGPEGPIGPTGATGATGPQGVQGLTGSTGSQGVQGPAGPDGVQGPQGERGISGTNGNDFNVFGLYETLYDLQIAHAIGNPGDAYGVGTASVNVIYIWDIDQLEWINIGALQGPQGIQGVTGPQGPQGAEGQQGIQGIEGPTGPQGVTGATGATGAQGPQGEQGLQGLQGVQGPQGATGAQGQQGIQGVAGINGKSAYTTAVEGGYSGDESTFNSSLAEVPCHISDSDIHITAEERTAWNNKDIMTDESTGKKYILGVDANGLYYKEVL